MRVPHPDLEDELAAADVELALEEHGELLLSHRLVAFLLGATNPLQLLQ